MKLIEGRRSAHPLRSVGDQLERTHPNESTWLANDPCLLALKVAPAGQVGQLRSQTSPPNGLLLTSYPWQDHNVALAEMLGTALLTVNRSLARAPMIRCSVELAGL